MAVEKYRTIYADPPWPLRGAGRIVRGAQRHYALMTVKEIEGLAGLIREITADEAHLWLWTTNGFLWEGLRVMEAWGFRYVTVITWFKGIPGMGQYLRGVTEQCLFGVRGTLPYRLTDDGHRSQGLTGVFWAPHGKRVHSQKPPAVRSMIERVSYPPRVELFARMTVDGWTPWGNETEKLGETPLFAARV